MTIQHLTNVKGITAAASAVGAKLPANVTAALDHALASSRQPRSSDAPGNIAAHLVATHLGNPDAFDKALDQAAIDLAAAQARDSITGHLGNAYGVHVLALVRREAETISAAFGKALKTDLTTLNESAGELPEGFMSEGAADLTPELFKVWTQCRDAWSRVVMVASALATIYPAGGGELGLRADGATALRAVGLDELTSLGAAVKLRDALNGMERWHHNLSGPTDHAVFTPTAIVNSGGRFEWAGPEVVAQRITTLYAGLSIPSDASASRW